MIDFIMYNLNLDADDLYFGVFSNVICFKNTTLTYKVLFACWKSVYIHVCFQFVTIFGRGLFTTFADFIGNVSFCFA